MMIKKKILLKMLKKTIQKMIKKKKNKKQSINKSRVCFYHFFKFFFKNTLNLGGFAVDENCPKKS